MGILRLRYAPLRMTTVYELPDQSQFYIEVIAMDIRFDPQADIRLLPYSPISPQDTLEVRIQLPPQKAQTGCLQVFSGTALWHQQTLTAREDRHTLCCFRHAMAGLSGPQTLQVLWDGALIGTADFTVAPPQNTLDGGFVILGGAENASVTKIFEDKIPQLSDHDWKTLMDEYNDLGFRCIIVQMAVGIMDFTSNALGAYFDSQLFPRAYTKAQDPIGSILQQAEKNGQVVFLGMCSPLFKGDLQTTQALMEELYAHYGRYPAFYGWYSSWEFGLPNATDDDFRLSVQQTDVKALRQLADRLSPVMPILYSPFTTSYTKDGIHQIGVHPSVLEGIANGALPFDILCPHDHCGQVHKLSDQKMVKMEDAVKIYAALKRACDAGGVHLWANCEGFNFTFSQSSQEMGYYHYENAFTPRHIGGAIDGQSGLAAHTALLRPYTEKVISFMVLGLFQKPGSAVELGNDLCQENYRVYEAYRQAPFTAYQNIAAGKPYALESSCPLMEPDNGHLFYNEFTCGAQALLHPDKNAAGLLTDGLMSGAQPNGLDCYLSTGYLLEHLGDTCRCSVTIDLQQDSDIHKVRCFTAHNPEHNPQHILAQFSTDGKLWRYLGENDGRFVNGWAEIIPDRAVRGRYVRLTYQKTNPANWRTWLILEEIEILQKWKEQA